MSKAERRKTHQAINSLTSDQVAAIVKQNFPRVKRARVNELAKRVVANAHRIVSPRKIQRG
jgi:ribosomal protein L11